MDDDDEKKREREREKFLKNTQKMKRRGLCACAYIAKEYPKKKKAKRNALFLYLVPRRDRVFDDRDVLLFRLLSLFIVRHDYILFSFRQTRLSCVRRASERVRKQKKDEKSMNSRNHVVCVSFLTTVLLNKTSTNNKVREKSR